MAPRTVAAVVTALLALAACSGAERDEAAPPRESPAPTATLVPGITDSARLSEPVVVRGRVLRADGTAVADALVQLTAEPTEEESAAIDPSSPVAATRTGPDGRYELRIAADRRAELPVDEDGLVRFVVLVDSPDGRATEFWTGPGELTHPHSVDLELSSGG